MPMVLLVDAGAGRANACGDQIERLLRGNQLRTAYVADGSLCRALHSDPLPTFSPARTRALQLGGAC